MIEAIEVKAVCNLTCAHERVVCVSSSSVKYSIPLTAEDTILFCYKQRMITYIIHILSLMRLLIMTKQDVSSTKVWLIHISRSHAAE